jgi:uncharacterized protein YndB with AHSA1/START domain
VRKRRDVETDSVVDREGERRIRERRLARRDRVASVREIAWTKAELFKRWWTRKSFAQSLLSCEMDVRVGGGYRLEFRVDSSKTMAFFGRYLEVTPPSRLVWTNDEAAGAGAVTTVTFEEQGGKTLVVMHDLYPSKEALDEVSAPTMG